jgi:CRP-like cAMP-binding protein
MSDNATLYNECSECDVRLRSVLCELCKDEVQLLSESKRSVTFKKGQTIYYEDSFPKYLYCITGGKVKLTRSGIDGKEQIVHLACAGDVIGYRAILCNEKYSGSAVAIEETTACLIPIQLFFSYIRENHKIAIQVIHLFSRDLKETERKLIDRTQRTVKERVAHTLLLFKESHGLENDGCTLRINIKREELASIAGTTRETATRILKEMKVKGMIDLIGKKIKIIRYKELMRTARVFD